MHENPDHSSPREGGAAVRPMDRPAAAGGPLAGSESTYLVSPPRPEGATKSWRKLVKAVDAREKGAFALEGKFLEPGIAYSISTGAVVVTVDEYPGHRRVAMTRVGIVDLEPEKEWLLKAPLGKRVTDYIGRRLPARAAAHSAQRLDAIPNSYAGRCVLCRNQVAARRGRLIHVSGYDRKRTAHHVGACPPPPEVITPNRRSEPCLLCGMWVNAREGVAHLRSSQNPSSEPAYTAAHTQCPVDGVPGPANRATGWCGLCSQPVPAGRGYWDIDEHQVRHRPGRCPDPEPEQVWWARSPKGEPWMRAGQVRRVQVDLRPGRYSVPDNAPVPVTATGFRMLSPTYVELVGRVLECIEDRAGRQWARVRAASGAEAVEVLAAEGAREAEAEPVASLLRGQFSAEVLLTKPWLAEITGRSPEYGWARKFQAAHIDYTRSNRKGTRGAVYHWSLKPNRLYETEYPVSRRERVKKYLMVDAQGDVHEISGDDAVAWLNAGATWPAH
ncbi:hypothetical protein ACFXOL_21030 [Streptomyces californicus]|uniref:hypothetical protein n=1 Tax=Streptomyces californicus TaxID=67351 RepID=UPI0036598245